MYTRPNPSRASLRSPLPMANGDKFVPYKDALRLETTDERDLPSHKAALQKQKESAQVKAQKEAALEKRRSLALGDGSPTVVELEITLGVSAKIAAGSARREFELASRSCSCVKPDRSGRLPRPQP